MGYHEREDAETVSEQESRDAFTLAAAALFVALGAFVLALAAFLMARDVHRLLTF